MTTTRFDKPTLRTLREDINSALAAVAAKHGIVIVAGSARFTDRTATLKLELAVKSPDGATTTPEAEAWKTFAPQFGFEPTDLGREVRVDGTTYRIAGCRPNVPRRPIVLTTSDGSRRVVASPDLVRSAIDSVEFDRHRGIEP